MGYGSTRYWDPVLTWGMAVRCTGRQTLLHEPTRREQGTSSLISYGLASKGPVLGCATGSGTDGLYWRFGCGTS
eukprot:1123510-Rhodomonas_salina.1